MRIATITSMAHPVLAEEGIEDGFYELEVHISLEEAKASGDVLGFCRHKIAQHLAQCVKSTGLPLNEKCWSVQFGWFMRKQFNYPKGIIT